MAEFEPKQFGKYFLLDKLATGGMAEIYKAKTFGVDGFEKLLVIKRILPHCSADKEFITMLTDEAKLSVMLSHANIVQVYDLGKVADDYFISMEYINGINLREVTYKTREIKKPIGTELSVFIASEMCKGLDYAHRKTDDRNHPLHIVHRDISPQNILISYEGEVKIVDFGIAKAAMNISHTMAGILKGKIAYMSPEQASGKSVDSRTDIFSTGILLYEMLTNSKLFTGESQFEVLQKIRTANVTKESLPESIPEQLRDILAKALASDLDKRYQTAGDMQIDLTRYLYVTFPDFTPRKLASFVREFFLDQLREAQVESARGEAMEQQTSSMNLEEGEKQVNIVHGETPLPESKSITAKERIFPKRSWKKPIAITAAALILAAGLGWIGSKLYQNYKTPAKVLPVVEKQVEPKPPVEETKGILNITSTPPGATIAMNGNPTGLISPATLEKLPINEDIKITLSKTDFENFEQVLKLTSQKPQDITATLVPVKPKAATTSMNISSVPQGANISINGKSTGKVTPATIPNLNVGEGYRVTLSMKGYDTITKTYTPKAGKPLSLKETLKKTEEVPPTPPVEKVEKPVEKPEKPEKPESTKGMGRLVVRSDPSGANVFVNGDHKGTTPIDVEAPSGKASILINKEGYTTEKRSVTIEAGKTKTLENISLIKESDLKLTIKSTPAAAEVTLDGVKIPPTPVIIKGAGLKMNKTYSIVISKDGYQTVTRTVTMDSAQKEVNVYLEKE